MAGGTFTDLVIHSNATGGRQMLKVLTTHDDPRRSVMAGVARLLGQGGLQPGSIHRVVRATTLITNALIERKGAKTGLITNGGFRDALEIRRERKYSSYDRAIKMLRPLVPCDLRLEISERCRTDFRAREATTNLLAFDMGGTTAKLSLIEGGEPLVTQGFKAARQKRIMEGRCLPIRISTVELIEIGAGTAASPG